MKDLQVLISRASPWFRRAGAVFLDKNGFRVFAGGRNRSDENIIPKNAPGKIPPFLLDILDPICTKGLSSYSEIIRKSDNDAPHLVADLNKQQTEYSLISNGIPSEKVADSVRWISISNSPQNSYLSGGGAILYYKNNMFCDAVHGRNGVAIMKV